MTTNTNIYKSKTYIKCVFSSSSPPPPPPPLPRHPSTAIIVTSSIPPTTSPSPASAKPTPSCQAYRKRKKTNRGFQKSEGSSTLQPTTVISNYISCNNIETVNVLNIINIE